MIGILQGIGAASRFSLAEIGRVPRRHRFALAVLRVVVYGVAPQGLSEDGGPRAEGAPARRSAFGRMGGGACRGSSTTPVGGACGRGGASSPMGVEGGCDRARVGRGRGGWARWWCAGCDPARAGRGLELRLMLPGTDRVPGLGGTGTGACRGAASPSTASARAAGPISARNRTDSRAGTRPISARNRTDLDAAGSQPLRETTRSAQGPA